jgi:basic membrane protein A
MKRMRTLAGISILALVLAACSSGTTDTAAEETAAALDDSNCAAAESFCVGLVTDIGKVDDKSFNQAAHEGAMEAAAEVGGFYKYIETTDPKDYAANMGQFTDKGYDVIVTVGFLMAEASAAAAKENPNTKFIGVDQFQAEEIANLTGLIFPEDQAGYAAGYLAGLMTKTNKLGQVLGLKIAPVEKFAKGFEAGALEANKNVSVTTVYHPPADNAFNDPVWGAAEAKKQLAQGADFIFGAGGVTGNGALGEVAKAKGAGTTVFCIGVDVDQWNTVPEARPCLITSAEKGLVAGTSGLVKAAFDGTIKGGNFDGTTGISDYHDLASVVPADVQSEVEKVVAGLKDKSILTGVTLG